MTNRTNAAAYDAATLARCLRQMDGERPEQICKGLPPSFEGEYGDIAAAGFVLGDARLPLPFAILREKAMANNRLWMSRYLAATDVKLAPHGKTSLAPALFRMQLEDGVWGLTAANAQQLAFFAHLGIRRVIVANQLVGAGNIAIVLDCAQAHPDLDFYVLADSREGVDMLGKAVAARPSAAPLKLLVEIGVAGGRTGVRDLADAVSLARHIHETTGVRLAGVEGYEGIVPGADQGAREAAVLAMIERMRDFAARCDDENLWDTEEILLTAGGTEFFDLCSEGLSAFRGGRPLEVVIRSGCYITSDSIAYKRAFERICERSAQAAAVDLPQPEGALEVWAAVQSRPEPQLAFATLGKRDISHDWDLPVPLRWMRPGHMQTPQLVPPGHRVLRLNDQHAYLEVPADSPLAVGDLVGFGVSHACTTFDKWRLIFVADEDDRITGAIRTYF